MSRTLFRLSTSFSISSKSQAISDERVRHAFQGKSAIEQVVSLQQVWKRLNVSEWQIINEIADATGATFEQVDQLLYQHPTLPDFIETMQQDAFSTPAQLTTRKLT
jgi:hypothetical protein